MADHFTRPQIRDRLTAFVARWSQRKGDEKSEAQTFLGELLDSYDTGWRQNTEVRFEHHYPSGGFADLLWKGNVLVEMKSKFTTPTLPETHWRQLFDYWDRSGFPDEGIGAPRYVVLCSFDRFVVWEPGEYPVPIAERPGPARIDLMLDELPERVEALDFYVEPRRTSQTVHTFSISGSGISPGKCTRSLATCLNAELDCHQLLRSGLGGLGEHAGAGEAPDDDYAREALDRAVDAEADQRDRAGEDAGRDHDGTLRTSSSQGSARRGA